MIMSVITNSISLSCDFRLAVQKVLTKLGDIFVARVNGNFVNTKILASMEHACGVVRQ